MAVADPFYIRTFPGDMITASETFLMGVHL